MQPAGPTTARRFCVQAAQLQSLRSSQQASSGSSSKPHVLLELMLLQAESPGTGMQSLYQQAACGSLALGSSYGSLQDDVTPLGAAAAADAASGDASAGSDGDVELWVLVSAASNVPMVPG